MVVDVLERAETFHPLHPALAAALRDLAAHAYDTLTPGRHPIDANRLIAIVQDYQTKPAADCIWESHRRYIDVQCVLSGVERMGHAPIAAMKIKTPYDAEKDAAFYDPPADGIASIATIHPGMFAIFFPHDAHQPGVMLASPAAVRKIVLKVAVDDHSLLMENAR